MNGRATAAIAGTVTPMNWGRLDDPAWWWEYALDGVIGGVLGGAVLGLAVWLTLRRERRVSALLGAQEGAARVLDLALRLDEVRTRHGVESEEAFEALAGFARAVLDWSARIRESWPHVSRLSSELRGQVLSEFKVTPVTRNLPATSKLGALVHVWLSTPREAERAARRGGFS